MSPGALFYRLSIGAQQLGYTSTTVDTLVDSIRLVDVLVLDLPALGRLRRTEARSAMIMDRSLRLQRFHTAVDGPAAKFEVKGSPAPDGSWGLNLKSSVDSSSASLPAGSPELASLWPLRLAFGRGLRRGRAASASLFDQFNLQTRDVTLRVSAESTLVIADSADYDSTAMAWVPVHFDTVRAFRLDGDPSGLRLWIDPQGRLVRATSPRGFSVERTAFEIAYENFRRRDTLRLMRASATPSAGDIVATTTTLAGVRPDPPTGSLRLRLGGGTPEGLDLESPRQHLRGDTLLIDTERVATQVASYRLPDSDTSRQRWLGPTPLIASGDLRVAGQARLLAAGERDPRRVVERLAHWVAVTVRDDTTSDLSGAAGVLNRRRGDCNARAQIFVAMARALGVPARPVAGLLRSGGRFYYHAWAEVYLGDWVAVDPTYDQLPADAAHVRLAIDAFARPLDLARLLAGLTLEGS